ncbi:MAG: LemA family protein [Anaerofustis sp.]
MLYIIIGICLLLVIILLWFIGAYNGFVKLKNSIEEAFATMDVYLKKRYDLIPNLVNTVKGYASYEASTLEKVIQARNSAMNANTLEERLENENQISGALKSIFALSEAYPDLKANTSFMDLQGQLQRTEDEIANSRKYYNAIVKQYNTKRETIPSSIVAGMFHFEKRPMFEVSDTSEREAVKVEF